MSSCGIDTELLRTLFDKFLLDRLPTLKALMCCDNGGAPLPGTDIYVQALDITTRDIEVGTSTEREVTVTVTRTDGEVLSDKFTVPLGGTGVPIEELHITNFTVTERRNGDIVEGYDLTAVRSDHQEYTGYIPRSRVVNVVDYDVASGTLTLGFDDTTTLTTTIPTAPAGVTIDSIRVENGNLVIVMTDGTEHTAPLPATLADGNTKVASLTVQGNELVLTDTDNGEFRATLPTGGVDTNTKIQSITVQGNELVITDTDNEEHRVTLPTGGTGATLATVTAENIPTSPGYTLTFTDTNGNKVKSPMLRNEWLQGAGVGWSFHGNTGPVNNSYPHLFLSIAGGTGSGVPDVQEYKVPIPFERTDELVLEGTELVLKQRRSVQTFMGTDVDDHGSGTETINMALMSGVNEEFRVDLAALSSGAVTWTGSTVTPTTTNTTPLSTTVVGDRAELLGKPYKYVEIEVDGEACLMPVYKKP